MRCDLQRLRLHGGARDSDQLLFPQLFSVCVVVALSVPWCAFVLPLDFTSQRWPIRWRKGVVSIRLVPLEWNLWWFAAVCGRWRGRRAGNAKDGAKVEWLLLVCHG